MKELVRASILLHIKTELSGGKKKCKYVNREGGVRGFISNLELLADEKRRHRLHSGHVAFCFFFEKGSSPTVKFIKRSPPGPIRLRGGYAK